MRNKAGKKERIILNKLNKLITEDFEVDIDMEQEKKYKKLNKDLLAIKRRKERYKKHRYSRPVRRRR